TDTIDQSTAAGIQGVVRAALGAYQVPGLFLGLGHELFASDDLLNPAGPAPDRTRLRGTVAAEDEITVLNDQVTLVPGLRWEIFHDDFPGTPGQPAGLGAGGQRTQDFLSPRVGVRAQPFRGFAILANLGRYAREPNLTELF